MSQANATRRAIFAVSMLAVVSLILLSFSGWYYGWSFVEKLLTRLAMPCGLVWIAMVLLTLTAFACGPRRWAWACLALTLFYWTSGSTYTANALIGLLERSYQPIDPETSPDFDAVIVLGGSTCSDMQGRSWLGPHGDRVMLAARLFGKGKIAQLVTTGQSYPWRKLGDVDMPQATQQIWTEIGVPADRISQIGGMNTSHEMREIRRWIDEHPVERVGLLTSAFHLPRALRLARRQGLDLIPIPADFMRGEEPFPLAMIPSSQGLATSEVAAKEFLAALVNR